jgi:hypothetical protein
VLTFVKRGRSLEGLLGEGKLELSQDELLRGFRLGVAL